jgi:hypothetical protein
MSLPGVVHVLPETDEVPNVEFAYDLRGTSHKMVCIHDGRANHFRGLVMKYKEGTRILVGRDCARQIWGINFDVLIKDFDLAKDTAYYLRRRNAAREAAPAFLAALAALRADPSIGFYQSLKVDFRSKLSNLASLMDDLLDHHDGVLFREDKVRDFEAESRRNVQEDEKEAPMTRKARHYLKDMGFADEKPKKQLEPIFRRVPRILGALKGRDFFATGTPSVGFRLVEFERRAQGAVDQLNAPHANLSELQRRLKGLADIADGIIGEIARLENLNEAFEAGNLSRIVDWANSISKDGTRYRADVGSIIAAPDRSDDIVISFPSSYRAPSREPFQAFRAAAKG